MNFVHKKLYVLNCFYFSILLVKYFCISSNLTKWLFGSFSCCCICASGNKFVGLKSGDNQKSRKRERRRKRGGWKGRKNPLIKLWLVLCFTWFALGLTFQFRSFAGQCPFAAPFSFAECMVWMDALVVPSNQPYWLGNSMCLTENQFSTIVKWTNKIYSFISTSF